MPAGRPAMLNEQQPAPPDTVKVTALVGYAAPTLPCVQQSGVLLQLVAGLTVSVGGA